MTPAMQSYSEYLYHYCLTPIVEKLAERGLKVTSEEMASWVGCPVSRLPPASTSKSNVSLAMPNFGGISSTPSRRGKVSDGPTCIYRYSRGDNQGKQCGKPCVEGSQYCKACMNKGSVTGNIRKGKVKETKESKMGEKTSNMEKDYSDTAELEVRAVEGKEKHFIQSDTGFLMKNLGEDDDPQMLVYGKETSTGTHLPLTEEDKKTIQKMGLGLSFYMNDPISDRPGH